MSTPRTNQPTLYLRQSVEDDESDILESAIDLFSLLSFVLIASTLLLGAAETTKGRPNSSRLSFTGFSTDAEVPVIPSGTILVVVNGSESISQVEARGSGDVEEKVLWSGDASALDTLEDRLSDSREDLHEAEVIALTLVGADRPDANLKLRVFYRVQAWLGKEQLDATVVLQ